MGKAVNNRLLDFLSNLNDAKSPAAAWDLTISHMQNLGACHMGLKVGLEDVDAIHLPTVPSWVTQMLQETVLPAKDPRLEHCRRSVEPYFYQREFSRQARDIPEERRQFDEELVGIGCRSAMCIPNHTYSRDQWGYFSFSTDLSADVFNRLYKAYGSEIYMSAVGAYNRISTLIRDEDAFAARLTDRERECLLWLARGHRTAEIAHAMGIRPVTVEFHVANVRRKLGARTREQALVRAVQLNVVTP